MATPRKSGDEQRTVSRTYRAAIRIGEDFITVEETIALPLDASDEEVTQAVDLGWRIFRAQREAADAQVTDIRSAIGTPAPITVRDPDSPASDKQRNYIVTLQDNLAWNSEHLAAYAEEQNVDLVTMTKGQAARDETRDANIAQRESADEAKHNGHLTKKEQKNLNRAENRNSRKIYNQKH